MANTKDFYARVQNKHDVEENWLKATNFAPLRGELIIYDPDEEHTYPRFKLGDGITLVNKLPFYSDFLLASIDSAKEYAAELDKTLAAADKDLDRRIDALEARKLFTSAITHQKISQDSNLLLSNIIETYILNIDYDNTLKFNVSEIVIGKLPSTPDQGSSTSSKLGEGVLGYMILG